MFAQCTQNTSGLSVHVGKIIEFPGTTNRSIWLLREAEINLLARAALQFGKQPRRRVGVMINMAAGSLATADAFPAVIASILKPVSRRSRQDGSVEKGAV